MFLNRLKQRSDEDLMRLIQQGEGKALTELYNRYSKLMLRYFFRMLWKDENKAQDFLHDLFVKIIERPESFDSSRRFSTWLYSVAHNMCKNEYRKKNYRDSFHGNDVNEIVIENMIHERIDSESFMKMLDKEVATWEDEDKSLFVFRHELEMTFGEIAEILKCPEGTVKSRWFYLRKSLAQQFQEFQVTTK
jgi:RNA polymerase sigma-70 factor, ECF subfamily